MLPELSEAHASGELAAIYAEIRATTGVPYVSSLQRHLATRPGWLPWAWSLVGPGFRSGEIPAAVWRVSAELELPSLPSTSASALLSLGVEQADLAAIRNVLESFARVSPTNLGFSGVVRHVLLECARSTPEQAGSAAPALPDLSALPDQPALSALPPMVDPERLPAHQREVVMTMATRVDDQLFIPGLYRMLARWPAWFAHAVTVLVPCMNEAELACMRLSRRVDEVVPALVPQFNRAVPSPAEVPRIVDAIERYRVTSPQMVVYSRMLLASLPPARL